jgi:hypothetical protein
LVVSIGILLASCPVGVVAMGMTGRVTSWMVSLVVQPLLDDHDLPKAILGVTSPLQDGVVTKGDFATVFVKKYLAARVAQDGNREEIVDKARKLMS